MLKKLFFTITCLCYCLLSGQQIDSLSFKNGIDNPSILPTHHFGIFSSRINANFKISSSKNTTIEFTSISGNNFHPFVEAYLPKDSKVQEEQSKLIWYHRTFRFRNQETTPANYMNIIIDAVIKEFRLIINLPISEKHDLGITLRSNLITKGKYPFTFFTSDETLEWFHSNVSGGEDPYGRRYYGLNQVNFKYQDRFENVLELKNNDFFFSGIEINHHYYPSFSINETKNIYFNFGSHLGVNTSKYNPSIDLGVSANAIKTIEFNTNYHFNVGVGMNILRKNIITLNDAYDLGNNQFLATVESDIEFTKFTKKRNYNSICVNYQIQSRYNKLIEADYYQLLGKWQEINGGWQHGIETLYKAQSFWTFIYTYGNPKYKLTFYFKEDFKVNNAPDFQTGISLKVPVFK